MISSAQIKPDTPVVCSKNGQFATVDHMEGNDTIKLKKDKNGQHHYIPLAWVTEVDNKVHVDRPGDQAVKEWSKTAKPTGAASDNKGVTAAPSARGSNALAKIASAGNGESVNAPVH